MSTYTALHGQIRIYDSTADLRSLAGGNVEIYDDSPSPTFTDVTSEARSAASSTTGTYMVATADYIYIGHTSPFARIQVGLDTVAVGTGTIVAEYYNGSSWDTLTVTDGTDDGTDTMAQDGSIDFKPPADWDVQGDASLDSDKYYVRFAATSVPGTPPDAEQIYPVDGQYVEVIFDEMNLTAPEGRARPEETVIFHRGRLTTDAHYITSSDTPVLEPLELSFSVRLDTTYNKEALTLALTCGNPNLDTNWDATGTSTKTDTKVFAGDGTEVATPAFDDSVKKTVCVQILWTRDSVQIGRAYHEVFFSPDQLSIAEAEDGVILSVTGLIYGKIESIYWFAYQF